MEDFVYHNPTKVLFGKTKIDQVGAEVSALGTRVLLVSGIGSARKSGMYSWIYNLLDTSGCTIIEFDGVQPNPTAEKAREGIALAKTERVEVVCAVGGGSVLDTGKAVRAGAVVDHDVWKFFTGKKSIRAVLPMVAVPTLAGSGSEMNSGMVLTNSAKMQKFGFGHRLLFPQTAIMDPQATYSATVNQTAFGAIDSFTHLLEFYLTSHIAHSDVQDHYMEGLAQAILKNCGKALHNACDYSARANLMWASALALNGLSSSGLGKVGFPMHLIEHSLSALYDIPHGAGLAVVVPGWLKYNRDAVPERMTQFFRRIFPDSCRSAEDLPAGIQKLEDWFISIGAPTRLEDIGLDHSTIEKLAENAAPLSRIWRMREYNQTIIENVLRLCLRNR